MKRKGIIWYITYFCKKKLVILLSKNGNLVEKLMQFCFNEIQSRILVTVF